MKRDHIKIKQESSEPPAADEDAYLICLSAEDQIRFAGLLLNPPDPLQALKDAKAAHSRLVRESR
jgi:hypothetical protein